MPDFNTFIGLIIRAQKVGDNDMRVHIFSASGINSYTLTGVLKPNAKLRAATQIFTIAEFTAAGHKITGVNVLTQNFEITKNIRAYYVACEICEKLPQICNNEKFYDGGILDKSVFDLTVAALANLADAIDPETVRKEYFGALS
jgi:recombinational DNA repair protein (RecF pathway)